MLSPLMYANETHIYSIHARFFFFYSLLPGQSNFQDVALRPLPKKLEWEMEERREGNIAQEALRS